MVRSTGHISQFDPSDMGIALPNSSSLRKICIKGSGKYVFYSGMNYSIIRYWRSLDRRFYQLDRLGPIGKLDAFLGKTP